MEFSISTFSFKFSITRFQKIRRKALTIIPHFFTIHFTNSIDELFSNE